MEGFQQIRDWLSAQPSLLKGRPAKAANLSVLFSGTGSDARAAAQKLATAYGRELHAVSLTAVVGKFIGETEKNLNAIFEKAANKGAVLFFDEADALFGKRTGIKDSHDRYANQEMSYLLQKMEAYPGLVVLATVNKSNLDPAFARRFRTTVEFPLPIAGDDG